MSGCLAEMALHIHKGLPNGTASLGAPPPPSNWQPPERVGWVGAGRMGLLPLDRRQTWPETEGSSHPRPPSQSMALLATGGPAASTQREPTSSFHIL